MKERLNAELLRLPFLGLEKKKTAEMQNIMKSKWRHAPPGVTINCFSLVPDSPIPATAATLAAAPIERSAFVCGMERVGVYKHVDMRERFNLR